MNSINSQTISFLRFPLCVAIVMVHSNIGVSNATVNQFPIYNRFSDFFIEEICFSSVALFFFISGYLFFHEGYFSLDIYRKKIHNRIYSILIPYILWNFICFAIIFCLQQYSNSFNLLLHKQILDFSPKDFIMVFWNLREVTGIRNDQLGPLVGQFWFLQNLFVYSLFSPLIWFVIKRLKVYSLLILAILAISCFVPIVAGFNAVYLYYFCVGAYFSIHQKNWYIPNKYIVLLLCGFIISYVLRETFHLINYKIIDETILIFLILNLGNRTVTRHAIGKYTILLANCSFFVFAIHRYFTAIGLNLSKNIVFSNGYMPILYFFVISMMSTLCSLGIYLLLKRLLPRVASILNGNRIKS